ncbi:MAG: sigma-70 family RNA polymerase sigma factor [Firmicutes bacterium]|nr:sigma-70 family RNA polymerase sigma factor [Bacillota bacterium]
MRNTLFDGYEGPRLPREVQLRRLKRVIAAELSACQREVLVSYYFGGKTIPQIAAERGVNKSTVCRTLRRAENRIRRCLRY